MAIGTGLALGLNVAWAQEETGGGAEEDVLELPAVRVTGSRLNRPPSELSGNLIILDREDIRASGELTLARVLRQLPQNINGTTETFGSQLNGTTNIIGASTVNLRGLGSEYTLILVDGRRIGHSGITGGVSDISTIPLAMVERIEVLLDGASAIYGSDAVGGVVNVITRKDYTGVDLDVNYSRPHKSGFEETRIGVSTGLAWDGGRANIGYEYFRDSGLDASTRDSIINANRDDTGDQQRGQPGPQVRLYSYFFDRSCDAAKAIVYELNGDILTRDEFAALNPEAQAMATCHSDITVPAGFMSGDDLNSIEIFGAPMWGEDTELGYSLRPDKEQNAFSAGVDQAISDAINIHANLRWTRDETTSYRGLNSFNGSLHPNSPYNPFGVRVTAFGQILGPPPTNFASERDTLFTSLGFDGRISEIWSWDVEFSRVANDLASNQASVLDADSVRVGMNSDGVSEASIGRFSGIDEAACAAKQMELGGTRYNYSSFFGGNCTVFGPPPTPINPFGDLSSYVAAGLDSGSENRETQFEALVRGELFSAPGGPVAVVAGYDYREDELDTFSEFHAAVGRCSPLICPSGNPAGAQAFNTSISRTIQAGFFEGAVPLIGAGNAMNGVQRLNLTFSGRYDSYSNVEVQYRNSESGEAGTDNPQDPGSEFTYSVGFLYQMNDSVRFRGRQATSFIAPQMNHLIQRTQDRAPDSSFAQLCLLDPDGSGCTFTRGSTYSIAGANDKLVPETADSISLIAEISPAFLPGVSLRAAWSDTDYENRILQLSGSRFNVDPDNLPGYIIYLPDEDIYLVETRFINVAQLQRTGVDYELRYDWEMGANDFSILVRRSYTNRYDIQLDPAVPSVQNLVETRDDSGPQDARVIEPVSRHKTNAQFTWSNGGLFASIDLEGASRVSTLVSTTSERVTEPATSYDLVIGYQFGQDDLFDAPAWLRGWQTNLTINNLTNAASRNYTLNPETGDRDIYSINPFWEWNHGRSYILNIRKSFAAPQ
ncbi:MAG: TonB-dependent receptor [Gammaproteobacteria bacterium]|nr:TonB-dependent receptor [Gammaproteobacteria bacterium]